MVPADKRRGRWVLQGVIAILIAAVLLTMTTAMRLALAPYLGGLSPFMLYIAAVLVAGLVSGSFCGALVMLVGGFLGYQLFLTADGVAQQGSILALMLFWGVAAPVLATASELRNQLRDAMARLSAAIDRKGQDRIRS